MLVLGALSVGFAALIISMSFTDSVDAFDKATQEPTAIAENDTNSQETANSVVATPAATAHSHTHSDCDSHACARDLPGVCHERRGRI